MRRETRSVNPTAFLRLATIVIAPMLAIGWLADFPASHVRADESTAKKQKTPAEVDADITRFLAASHSKNPAVRPQAAARLRALGSAAAPRLLRECGETPQDMARLAPEVIEILGELGDARLRAKLWQALGDPDFPWRPACLRSLAHAPQKDESERFVERLQDPIGAVRVAAIEAVSKLKIDAARGHVRNLLDDPDDRVRRAAAVALDAFGHRKALLWLVEDLRRTDRFFYIETGRSARYEAVRAIEERLGDRFGYEPGDAPETPANRAAIARVRAKIIEITNKNAPPISDVARAGSDIPGNRLGLEIRSCRRGEIWLRWNEKDRLLVGTGNPASVELPKGTTAKLVKLAREAATAEDRRIWGEPGCDHEQFYVALEGESVETFRMSKGPAPVDDLRPDALDALARALLTTLPESGTDPRLANLRERTRHALEAVGGPIDTDSAKQPPIDEQDAKDG